MKKTIRLIEAMRSIAIIAIVAVIGFSMAGCGEKGGGGGTLTVTGIDSKHNGKWAMFQGDYELIGVQSYNSETTTATLVQIAGGKVSLPMWIADNNGNVSRFSGSESAGGMIIIYNSSDFNNFDFSSLIALKEWDSITFNHGSAEIVWSEGAVNP